MLSDKCLIRSIRLQNFLSFGGSAEDAAMKPLNVFIGPNSSGKSNLFEAIGLLAAAPKDLTFPIREGGGVSEWLWKGKRETRGKQKTPAADIDVTVHYPDGIMPLRYKVSFGMVGQRFELVDEAIENEQPQTEPWPHLKLRDNWNKPNDAFADHAHLMVQTMEAWFLADKESLAAYFGREFNTNALPAHDDVESISKAELYQSLKDATRPCKKKGEYDKGAHSFGILALIDPGVVRSKSPHTERLISTLHRKADGK